MLLLLGVLLAAAPPVADSLRLASPGLKCVNIDRESCEFFSDYFAQQLTTLTGVRIVTQSEISTLLGLERQRQLLGCSDNAESCVAEMAGALGVDAIITGNRESSPRPS